MGRRCLKHTASSCCLFSRGTLQPLPAEISRLCRDFMRDNTEISALTALKSLLERHLCSVDGTKAAPAFKSRLFSTKIPLLFPFLADEIMKYMGIWRAQKSTAF